MNGMAGRGPVLSLDFAKMLMYVVVVMITEKGVHETYYIWKVGKNNLKVRTQQYTCAET